MMRVLALATLVGVAAVSLVACNSTDLVIDQNRGDTDTTDDDDGADGGAGDNGPHVLAPPVVSIEVYNVTSTTVQLAWTHDEPAGCCTFRVYYSGASNGPFTLFGEVNAPPRITGLTAETLYYFYVTAVQNGVESAPSITRPVLTKPGLAPNFRVSQVGGGGVVVAWDAVDGASGFNVYRSEPGGTEVTDASEVVHVGGFATSAVIDGLASATTYTFKMNVEKGAFRFGDLSAAISATTTEPMAVTSFTPDHGFDDQTVTITGERFGTVAADVTVIFEGEAGPGDEKTSPATAVTDTTVTAKVPVGAATGTISVRRILYSKATSTTAYDVGVLYSFNRVLAPTSPAVDVTALHAATATQVLVGRADGALLRSLNGSTFVALDYTPAFADALDCAGDPFDSSVPRTLSAMQCTDGDCLLAIAGTCTTVRLARTFENGSTTYTDKRIGPPTGAAFGTSRWLACGNPTNAAGCLSLDYASGTLEAAYTTNLVSTDFAEITPTFPSGASFTWRGTHSRPSTHSVVVFGSGGIVVATAPTAELTVLSDAPSDVSGADCAAGATNTSCIAALGAAGVVFADGALPDLTFDPPTGLPTDAVFNDAVCTGYRNCVAVGGINLASSTDERGIVAQTRGIDGHWYWRTTGTRELRRLSCVSGVCFASDREGGIWRGN